MLKKELFEIIACPKCKGPVQISDEGLHCQICKLLYPIKDGIPVMLVEEAKVLDSQ